MSVVNHGSNKANDPASQIESLSPAKLALLARRLKAMRGGTEQTQSIPRRSDSDGFAPLSFAQERLWFIDQLNPGKPSFNLYGSFRGKGMSPEVYQQVLSETVRRQQVLRTIFPTIDGQTVQVASPSSRQSVPVVDLSEVSEAEQKELVALLEAQERLRPFNLDHERPLRATMIVLDRSESVLLLTVHHIAVDAWSWDELLSETQILYKEFSSGAQSSLPELPIQYADYAQWQREWLKGPLLENQIAYWKEQLDGSSSQLELPTDRPRSGKQTYLSGREGVMIDRDLTVAIKTLTRGEGVTTFMSMLAAFYALLYKYTGQEDINIGVVISNRNRSQLEKIIGLFINTLVLRSRVDASHTFRELIKQVRQVTSKAYAHSDVPIEMLKEALRPERESALAPIFRILFDLDNSPASAGMEESSGLDVKRTDGLMSPEPEDDQNTSGLEWVDIDLSLSVLEHGDQLYGGIRYNAALFDASTIRRMLRHFQTLLESAVADPEQLIGVLPILPVSEAHQLLTEWNDTATCDEQGECISSLFLAQRERTPDAVAAVFDQAHLTYRELDQQANRVARHLRRLGIGQERLVAIVARRGLDFLTVVLATFKTGAAYLPLDPNDPPNRLRQVLSQSNPDLVLTAEEFIEVVKQASRSIRSDEDSHVASIDALRKDDGAGFFSSCCAPRNLSYVIYTSGSTGIPKGAMVEHAGMLNHLRAKISSLQLTASDVVAQTASQSFDISVWQFLAALLVGGRVQILDDETAHNPLGLLEMVERGAVTILETVPSLLAAMLEETPASQEKPYNLTSLRWMLVTGEALPPELCLQWQNLYPGLLLLNAYGPTECSDDVTHYSIRQHCSPDLVHMSVGRPVNNIQVYVLDKTAMIAPPGVFGELHVGGIGVGRGYLNDAARTAQVFVPDGFSQGPGARLYRTGDMVRYLPDGNIEFRGRLDHQVKIRGHRIELAEIEVALGLHPSIKQAVVLAREEGAGNKRLVAYVVADELHAPGPIDLHNHLQEHVPDYMIPSAFVFLDALPLTPNGKTDRNALPAPDEGQTVDLNEFVPPETDLEKKLAGIWSDLLEVDQIGIFNNFFHLGGHSLLAIQLINRMNHAFNVTLSVRNIFEEPTIAGLALVIEEMLIEALEAESD